MGGTIPVRFPSLTDPGDAGWHIEASYQQDGRQQVNVNSRARGLLVLYLFSDVDEASAPTRIRPGSHRDAARVLAPAGDDGLPWLEAATAAADASAGRATALAAGQAGDVFLCHPFLVHAASWPHRGRIPRMMAQPGVALHTQFPLTAPLSPVEQAIVAGFAAESGGDRRLEQGALALDAAHGVVVEDQAADAPVLGQRARLQLDRLRGEHALHRGQQGVSV